MSAAIANPFEMRTPAAGEGSKFENPPEGNHPGRLVAIVDLGSHADNFNPGKFKRQCFLVWELVGVQMTGMKDTNHLIGERYTFSLNEKAKLRGMIDTWRGKKLKDGEPFDVRKLLGQPCLVGVIENESKDGSKKYANLGSVSKLPTGMTVGEPQHKPVAWHIGCGEDLPSWLPYCYGQQVKDIIAGSKEAIASRGGPAVNSANTGGMPQGDEEIPF
jgi:hypothetical protein